MTDTKLLNWNQVLETNSPTLSAGEHLTLTQDWLYKLGAPLMIEMTAVTTLLFYGATSGWHIIAVGALLCAFCVSAAMFNISMDTLRYARDCKERTLAQWEADKAELLIFERMRIENERERIGTVKVSGGNVSIGAPQTNQTLNIEDRLTARMLAKHFSEFVQYANSNRAIHGGSGFERERFITKGREQQWRDGLSCDRPEYETLIDVAESAGLLMNRGKGKSGDVPVKLIGTSVPSHPTDANQV